MRPLNSIPFTLVLMLLAAIPAAAQTFDFRKKAPRTGESRFEATRMESRSETEITIDGESRGGSTSSSSWTMRGYTALAVDGERVTRMRVDYRRLDRESRSDMEALMQGRGGGRRRRAPEGGEEAPASLSDLVGASYEIDLGGAEPVVTAADGSAVPAPVARAVLGMEAPGGRFAQWENSTVPALDGRKMSVGETIVFEGEVARRIAGFRARRGGRRGGDGEAPERPGPETRARLTLLGRVDVLGRPCARFDVEITVTPPPRTGGRGRRGGGANREPRVYRGEIMVGLEGLGLHRLRLSTSSESDQTREMGENALRIRRSARERRNAMMLFADARPPAPPRA